VIVDTNVNLSRWPFRRLSGDDPATLVARLKKHNVSQAWAGSFDGIFHKDIAGVNARLASDCRTYGQGILLPFGSINPKLPDWQEDLRRCHEEHKMRGIRLHPNYHGYQLQDALFKEVLKLASSHALIVQLALCMEDERTQHPLMRVPPVDITPLVDLAQVEPKLKLVVLNSYPQLTPAQITPLIPVRNVYFELSMVERVGAVTRLIETFTLERVLFGSHSPFFYFESAELKVQEAGLSDAQERAVLEGNARRLLS
jgi:predicted TIM-barrel fold metal-dependent hydrolase